MTTLIVMGMVAAVAVILLAGLLGQSTRRRTSRFASSNDTGFVPWMDGGGGSSGCDASDGGGCGDGGGGGD